MSRIYARLAGLQGRGAGAGTSTGRSGGGGYASVPLLTAVALCLGLVAPLLYLLSQLGAPSDGIFAHLAATVLPGYARQSLLLAVLTGLSATLLGTALALLTGLARFPGRGFFAAALVLPLALPGYIAAYVYTDLLEFSGPLQAALRALLDRPANAAMLPPIRSLGGAVLVLTLVLYPYAYMIQRAVLALRQQRLIDTAQSLGVSPLRAVFRVLLPICMPAAAGSFALIGMECLGDYGVTEYFGVSTLAVGVYRVWFGMGSLTAAAQLSLVLLALALALLLIQMLAQKRLGDAGTARPQVLRRFLLPPLAGLLAAAGCGLVLLLGFALPTGWLAWLWLGQGDVLAALHDIVPLSWRSLWLAGLAALLTVIAALVLALCRRVGASPLLSGVTRLALLGYAIPGSVLAVAAIGLFGAIAPAAIVSGGVLLLLYGYAVRFLTPAFSAVGSGLDRLPLAYDRLGATLGRGRMVTALRVHLPLLRPSMLTGGLLVLVEAMKELPMTLALRPFAFETLATRIYRLAGDERLAEASAPALLLVLIGLLPVMLLLREPRQGW